MLYWGKATLGGANTKLCYDGAKAGSHNTDCLTRMMFIYFRLPACMHGHAPPAPFGSKCQGTAVYDSLSCYALSDVAHSIFI